MFRIPARLCIVLAVALCVAFSISSSAAAAGGDDHGITPTRNNLKKWRVGYVEGGPYQNYQRTLREIVRGLQEIGWVAPAPLPDQPDFQDTSALWAWLAQEGRSEYIEFVPDAYWTAVWNDQIREANKAQILERLGKAKDLDLVIAMGTWAGLDLSGRGLPVAVEVASASDPVGAGIVASADDSGRDNLHAHVDQNLVETQVRLFHQVTGFKRLGMFFEDTDAGRSYAGLDVVQHLAGELGFKVVQCNTVDDSMDQELSEQSVLGCADTLAGMADAVYLTDQNGLTPHVLPLLLESLYAAHVPTFIQTNLGEVRSGVTFGLSEDVFRSLGRFHAWSMAKVFNGAKPRALKQVLRVPAKLVVNLEAARRIGFDPPLDILQSADELYDRMQP